MQYTTRCTVLLSVDTLTYCKQDPRNQLNFCISGLVYVECTAALYKANPEIQNSVEIGDLKRVSAASAFESDVNILIRKHVRLYV